MGDELTRESIKAISMDCGADLCGVAPVERFSLAPAGFHPRDVFEQTRSVAAFAVRVPDSAFASPSAVPYTFFTTQVLDAVSKVTYELVCRLEGLGLTAVPVPSEPYEFWDNSTKTGKGTLSLRHAAALAGLGTITRNHLLTNRRYGNRIALGAVLLDAEIDPDPLCDEPQCPAACNVCRELCRAGAISDEGVDQRLCRFVAEGPNERGFYMYWCRACREKCPLSKRDAVKDAHL